MEILGVRRIHRFVSVDWVVKSRRFLVEAIITKVNVADTFLYKKKQILSTL